jgi:hypothetical protein
MKWTTSTSNWEKMKNRFDKVFRLKPILHFDDVMENNGRSFIVVKPCGFLIKTSIVWMLLSCKHTFHPFYLGAMLKSSNKCCVCKF